MGRADRAVAVVAQATEHRSRQVLRNGIIDSFSVAGECLSRREH